MISVKYTEENVFLITGATSGIGYATALALCKEGATVIAIGRNSNIFSDNPLPNLHFVELDIGMDQGSIVSKVIDLACSHGSFSGAVLAAGYQSIRPFASTKISQMKEMFDVNFFGNLAIAQAFHNKKVFSEKGCSIIFVSSISSFRGEKGILPYAATKGAINSAVKTMALEFSSKKIRVNSILPGLVKTELVEKNKLVYNKEFMDKMEESYPLGLGTVNDVVKPILFLLSEDSKWITGSEMVIDGGGSI
jgi:NAD(P)-dependent dehydrogenase (short-subunit alcohol dehydrogenase family)